MWGFDNDVERPTRPLDAERAWEATVPRVSRCVMSFDFDGVLAPVTEDPDASRPLPESLSAINALASAVHRVTIISARARSASSAITGTYGSAAGSVTVGPPSRLCSRP